MPNIEKQKNSASSKVWMDPPSPPPPPGYVSPFSSVNEWLNAIANDQPPSTKVSTYYISIIECPGNSLLTVEGYNETEYGNETVRRIVYTPNICQFYSFKDELNPSGSYQQRVELLVKDLQTFIESGVFKNSFLSLADKIETNFSGRLWLR